MRKKKSGPAIFMYCVIAITLIISAVCFFLYYSNITQHNAVLWVAIVSFMIMYHLWLRIIMGNVTKQRKTLQRKGKCRIERRRKVSKHAIAFTAYTY